MFTRNSMTSWFLKSGLGWAARVSADSIWSSVATRGRQLDLPSCPSILVAASSSCTFFRKRPHLTYGSARCTTGCNRWRIAGRDTIVAHTIHTHDEPLALCVGPAPAAGLACLVLGPLPRQAVRPRPPRRRPRRRRLLAIWSVLFLARIYLTLPDLPNT
jgi:hypothetical protein